LFGLGRGNANDPGWDMALLTSCDHLIITYGSYGIMAAYFLAGRYFMSVLIQIEMLYQLLT
jgi:Glycosyl transferase family 11